MKKLAYLLLLTLLAAPLARLHACQSFSETPLCHQQEQERECPLCLTDVCLERKATLDSSHTPSFPAPLISVLARPISMAKPGFRTILFSPRPLLVAKYSNWQAHTSVFLN